MWIYYGSLALSVVFSLMYRGAVKSGAKLKIGRKEIPWKTIFAILIPLPLIFVMGFRSYVGKDYYEYLKIFVRTGYNVSKEIGYTALSKVAEFLSFGRPNKTVLFTLVAVWTMGFFTAGWIRYPSKNLTLTVYLFVTMGYFVYALNIQRQYIAMAVIVFGWKWLNENWKDAPKFLACVLVGALFHTSALIMIPGYFLLRKTRSMKFWISVYVLAGAVCVIKWPVLKFVYHYLAGKMRLITLLTYFTTEFSPVLIAIFAILTVLAVLFRGRLLARNPRNGVLINSIFTAFMGYSFLTYIFGGAMIDRFTQYFAVASVLFIPEVISSFKTHKMRFTAKAVVYAGFGAWFLKRLLDDRAQVKSLVPYAWELSADPDTVGKVMAGISVLVLAYYVYHRVKYDRSPAILRVQESFPLSAKPAETAEDLKVSVIVPVYKVEKYLRDCLDSLLSQTYTNFEIVAVNDGSPDGSLKILEKYAKKDSRIKIFSKENGGIADVRNYGIQHAEGDLIAYVDSDDAVHPEFLRVLVSSLKEFDADIAAVGFVRYYEDTGRADYARRLREPKVMNTEEAIRDYLSPTTYTSVNTWNKIYRKEILTENGITFPKGKIYEDALTMHKIYACASRVVYTDEPLYYYRQRFGSIMNAAFDERCLALRTIYPTVAEDLRNLGYELNDECEIYHLVNDLNMLNAVADSRHPDKALFEEMRAAVLAGKEGYRKNPYITKKQILALKLAEMGRPVYIFARRVLKWLGNI